MPGAAADLGAVYRAHRQHVFGVCYRMTGSVSDADDLVQETFARALQTPPRDTSRDWRPWLVRVAVNLSRDHLRRRRRSQYVGPWLPEPFATQGGRVEPAHEPASTAGRYELLESCSYAFLIALERLTPTQRAVLLLREVLEYSSAETAHALALREANVRQHLHRARRAMAEYDAQRCSITPRFRERTREVLSRYLACVARGDTRELEQLLTEDVIATSDGGGRYFAARKPIVGRSRVIRASLKIIRFAEQPPELRMLEINAVPGLVGRYAQPRTGHAPAFVYLGILDPSDRLRALHTVVAPDKLAPILSFAQWGRTPDSPEAFSQ